MHLCSYTSRGPGQGNTPIVQGGRGELLPWRSGPKKQFVLLSSVDLSGLAVRWEASLDDL